LDRDRGRAVRRPHAGRSAPVDAPLVPLGERIGASSHFTVCGLVQWLEHASTEEEVCDALEWFVEAGILRAKA